MQPLNKAKLLRKNSTRPEKILWNHLRNRRLAGYKFRRQYPVEHYIVDFICLAEKLIIELDGKHHQKPDQLAYDQARSQFLDAGGYKVLRFSNQQITKQLPEVLQKIEEILPQKC